jgi:GTP-binding protein
MFVDQVKVTLLAGRGGNGCMSFRRERGVPRGGPNGGHGGEGGSIFLVSDEGINSLVYFHFHPIHKARKGAHGRGSNRHGKKGENLFLKVPVGTVVRGEDKKAIFFDFTAHRQETLAAKGGKGGRGNAAFATSTNQAPRIFEEGKPGEECEFVLELKLIADVGLIGFPNVGKSTLISKVSAAKPVIADYPFTTLVPNLGVVDVGEFKSFVLADIPGLIEGAHRGHGLGIKFLRHVERTKILVHIVDISPYTQRDPVQDYHTIMIELEAFDAELAKKPQLLVANKMDILGEDKHRLGKLKELAHEKGFPFHAISALKEEGLKELVYAIAEKLDLDESR